jgi:L-amino acid N-acyltransferase YncA
MKFKEYELQQESIRSIVAEITPLHQLHYKETETKYLTHKCAVNYTGLGKLEAARAFVIYTARHEPTGAIVGYAMFFLGRSMHGAYQVATEDAWYVVKEHRGSGLARQLLRFAETDLKTRAMDYVFMSSKGPVGAPNVGPMLDVEGYQQVAVVYAKKL